MTNSTGSGHRPETPLLGTAHIVRGNALDLSMIDDSSVDLVVTSPPYIDLRSYKDRGEHYEGQIGHEPTADEYLDALIAATREQARLLKPSGSIFVNLGDSYGKDKSLMLLPQRYVIRCRDELGLLVRAEIIWSKPNPLPDSAKDRVGRRHEYWFHLTKTTSYYADLDPIREPYAQPDRVRADVFGGRSSELGVRHAGASVYTGPTSRKGKLPGSVWTIPTEPLKLPDHLDAEHFAAFPSEWPRRLISAFCPPGGVVLDPFGGTGTTAAVAVALGRDGTSVDLSGDYTRIAQWRVQDPKLRAKIHARTAEAPGPAGDAGAAR